MEIINNKGIVTKIYAKTIEDACLEQLNGLVNNPAYENETIRIMPDTHTGKGSVIGFTSTCDDMIIPNTVGVDISCGMLCVNLGKVDIDMQVLDNLIRLKIPSGLSVHEGRVTTFKELEKMNCFRNLKDSKRIVRSIGTLGGGNHFIELDRSESGDIYLVIHTGSRNLGKQVCEYYQKIAVDLCHGKEQLYEERERIIREYKRQGRRDEIQKALRGLKCETVECNIPDDQCYLYGKYMADYLHDADICSEFAHLNRLTIADIIISKYFKGQSLKDYEWFETLHNYVDTRHCIIRKGAISAMAGEKVIIPMNMRDGSLICIGKGNDDWNCSAPHGAGRLMSRTKAFDTITLDDFKQSMNGIFTTSVNNDTIDESPMAYKPMDEILELVKDTVDVVDIIKPIYNFKASGELPWRKDK
ncbi:MAG: RtcB family protein [Bacteroidales bacterium]|nr:RtcB family protein [Bacteroidales bacterium]